MGRFWTSRRPATPRVRRPRSSASCRERRSRRPMPLLLALLVALLAAAVPAASPLAAPAAAPQVEQVLRSDAERLVFALQDLQPVWTEHALRGGTLVLYQIGLPGFPSAGEPGRPRLPRRGGWIVLPPGKRAVLQVRREQWQDLPARRLLPAPTPVVIRDAGHEEPRIESELLLPGERPRRGEPVAGLEQALGVPAGGTGGAVSLGEPVPWRGRRIVPYVVAPVQADDAGRALRCLAAGEWEVRFVDDPAAAAAPAPAKRTAAGDDRFGFAFLNGDRLDAWPTEAAAGFARPKSSSSGLPSRLPSEQAELLAPEVKIPVSRTRLYRVTAAGLRQAGLLPAEGIAEDQIRLYQRYYDPARDDGSGPPWVEVEVPIRLVGEGDQFDGDDFFLFWGLRPRDDTNDFEVDLGAGPVTIPGRGDPNENWSGDNIYWLAAAVPPAGTAWARMERLPLDPATGPPAPGYRRTEYIEEDFAYEGTVYDARNDRYHWNDRQETKVEVDLPVRSADPAGAGAQLRLGIVGSMNTATERPLDVVAVADGVDHVIGTVTPMTIDEFVVTGALEQAWLADTTLRVRIQREGGVVGSLYGHLDWLELSYDAIYRARLGRLDFPAGPEPGDRDLVVGGFAADEPPGLVEITDPRHPAWIDLAAANLVADGDGTAISLHVPDAAGRRFYAEDGMAGTGTAEIVYGRCRLASGRLPEDGAPPALDLLVVVHPEFADRIGRWVEHRRQRSGGRLAIQVADVDDVYDAYSGGLHSPWAVRRLVTRALNDRGAWALQLVGDANENARGLGTVRASDLYFNQPVDWVPTHLHAQNTGLNLAPEILASDDWFASPYASNYPDAAAGPPQMVVGRFPCNTDAELDAMIDKVLVVESPSRDQAWRRRGIFWADDAWSYGYGAALYQTTYSEAERQFEVSEDSLASWWGRLPGVGLEPRRYFLSTYLDPVSPPPGTPRNSYEFRQYAESLALPPLLALLREGALVVHFQGHANSELLTHEVVFQDSGLAAQRRDVSSLDNQGRPFVFYGMGCHIADWAQNTARGQLLTEPSLAEKLLVRPGAGAVASYASSGYEYLGPNVDFSEMQLGCYLQRPPVRTVDGRDVRSRWVLGELVWKSEAELLATYTGPLWRQMAAQYELLGDALLVLDAGPPRVTARAVDAPADSLTGTVELAALDTGNVRRLQLVARDEAGIDRVEVTDSDGTDLSGLLELVAADGAGDQRQTWELPLPVRPFDHEVDIAVWDTGRPLPDDGHWQLRLRLPLTGIFGLDGQPIGAGEIPLTEGEPVPLTLDVHTAAWLDESWPVQLTGEGLDVSGLEVGRVDEHDLALSFTIVPAVGGGDRVLRLAIDGYVTEWVLGEAAAGATRIAEVQAFPNPMADRTRFLLRADAPLVGSGRILVFSLAGRPVARLPVLPEDFQAVPGDDGQIYGAVVDWDGRDGRRDELANGVYLYRAEIDAPGGRLSSPMQRLLIMR